jgi:putative hydrolase of the HAD superfamily
MNAVIFDCFGVFYVDTSKHIAQQAGPKRAQVEDLTKQAAYGHISRDEYARKVGELLGESPQQVSDYLFAPQVRNQALLAFSQSLRPRYKIGLLSNVSLSTMDTFFTAAEREQLFDAVVLSSQVGLIKPQPEIFQLACQRLGVAPHQAIMVDDSPQNCAGAKAAGLHAVQYTDTASAKTAVLQLLGEPNA